MPAVAKLRYLRIAPRKVRLVADLVRGKKAEKAQSILNFTIKKASPPLLKLLNQALANAKNNFQLDPGNLFISKITVDEGPKYKRWQPRSRGQAYQIQKKTSHITILLDEMVKKTKKRTKKEPARNAPATTSKMLAGAGGEKAEKAAKIERPRFKPDLEVKKPKTERGIKRFFRRKAIG
ncbi:MAG: 50S ribosomal protein L22 [bacterium]